MTVKVGMVSLGCPKNQADAELMLAALQKAGYTLEPDPEQADAVIINTCGFIEDAKREAIETILEFGRLKKEGKIQKLIVTGCLAQRVREEMQRELPECDAVVGLGGNADIAQVVADVMRGETVSRFPSAENWSIEGDRVQTTPFYTAYLRIGDGCDNRCAYCAIPLIRGKMRSREPDMLLREARSLAESGVKELVVVAQDTTLYGRDLYGESRLPRLLERLCDVKGIEWIRLLYAYPEHITGRLLDVMAAQPKIVKYLDVPLQHADGAVLRAMGRQGDRTSLTRLFARIRQRVPGIVLRTTVMTGFPGETPQAFEELCAFLADVRFEWLGCFPYSREEGTRAAELPNQVPEKEKERRRDIVMAQQQRFSGEWLQTFAGKTLIVLAEGYDRAAGRWIGRCFADAPEIDGKVFFSAGKTVRPGDFVNVRITDVTDLDLLGETE